ncbi:hypothetical protein L596_021439 [Steinernema carpocapsae]|uniref:Uncharacterized protein n=1 Tax=Steinernema carpocapsae TaxID=34508 RepID=A0A4U5MIS4_STECR|nr:hypothetical protein L596_021439 [Steinernema carpocapsae]
MSLTETLQLVTSELTAKTLLLQDINDTITVVADALLLVNIGLVVGGAALCIVLFYFCSRKPNDSRLRDFKHDKVKRIVTERRRLASVASRRLQQPQEQQ